MATLSRAAVVVLPTLLITAIVLGSGRVRTGQSQHSQASTKPAPTSLLELLDDAAERGATVKVDWFCDPDDDITREFAEDIAAEVNHASVSILDLDAD